MIVDEIRWTLKGEGSSREERIYKNSMMVLDILANNNWERPVYFAITVSSDNFLNLQNYFQMDGLAYRFVPLRRSESKTGGVDADKLYDKMMNQFRWGNVSDPKVYLCETNTRLLTTFRGNSFSKLASALIAENKMDSAVMVLDRAYEVIPTYQLSFGYFDLLLLRDYYRAGAKEKGDALAEKMFKSFSEELAYLQSFPKKLYNSIIRELNHRKYMLIFNVCDITRQYDSELFEKYKNYWETLFPDEPWDMTRMFLMQQGILFYDDDFEFDEWEDE